MKKERIMTILNGNAHIELVGRGEVTIRPSNYVATGGEGSVYRLNDTIVKLYTDPTRMLVNDFGEKLKLLSSIKHNQIVAPAGTVKKSGREIGYYMPYVAGEPLSRMFTNDFIVRNSITNNDTVEVVRSMREIILVAHKHNAVLTDANELNWLVELRKNKNPLPYVIDVDSWSIGRWKGAVIMPSIRDYHTMAFNEQSDWFAWGVVTFQLFTGVHPYKGVLNGFERGNLEARMRANASVFAPGVKLSHAVRDFALIPRGLARWYEEVFQQGKRLPPPEVFDVVSLQGTVGKIYRVVTQATGRLTYTKLYDSGNSGIVNIFPSGVLARSDGVLVDIDSKKELGTFHSKHVELVEVDDGYIIADFENGNPLCTYVERKTGRKEVVSLPFEIKKFVRVNDRLFGVHDKGLMELIFHVFKKVIASVKATWNALPQSTDWLSGFGLQNALGAMYLIYPYGDDMCAHIRMCELDDVTVIQGVRGHQSFSFVGVTKTGDMMRYDMHFSKDYKSYVVSTTLVDVSDISQVTLVKGVCVEITDDGKLEARGEGNKNVTVVEDKSIFLDGKLYQKRNTVLYVRKGEVWSISMR